MITSVVEIVGATSSALAGAKVIAVLIIRIFGEIVPISLGIILNALSYLLVSIIEHCVLRGLHGN